MLNVDLIEARWKATKPGDGRDVSSFS